MQLQLFMLLSYFVFPTKLFRVYITTQESEQYFYSKAMIDPILLIHDLVQSTY